MKKHQKRIFISTIAGLVMLGGLCGFAIPILQKNTFKKTNSINTIPTWTTDANVENLNAEDSSILNVGNFDGIGSGLTTILGYTDTLLSNNNLSKTNLEQGVIPDSGLNNVKLISMADAKPTDPTQPTYFRNSRGQAGVGEWLNSWYEEFFKTTINENTGFADSIGSSFNYKNTRYGNGNRNATPVVFADSVYFKQQPFQYNKGAVKSLSDSANGNSIKSWPATYNQSKLLALNETKMYKNDFRSHDFMIGSGRKIYELPNSSPNYSSNDTKYYRTDFLDASNYIDNVNNPIIDSKNFQENSTFTMINNEHYFKSDEGGRKNALMDIKWASLIIKRLFWWYYNVIEASGNHLIDKSTYEIRNNLLNSASQKQISSHSLEFQKHNTLRTFEKDASLWGINPYVKEWYNWNDQMGNDAYAFVIPQNFLQDFYKNGIKSSGSTPLLQWTNNNIKSVRTIDIDISNLLTLLQQNQNRIKSEQFSTPEQWEKFFKAEGEVLRTKGNETSLIQTNILENAYIHNLTNSTDIIDFSQQQLLSKDFLGAGAPLTFVSSNDYKNYVKNGYNGNSWVINLKLNSTEVEFDLLSPKLKAIGNKNLIFKISNIMFEVPFIIQQYGFLIGNMNALNDRPRWWFNTILKNWITQASSTTNNLVTLNNLLKYFVNTYNFDIKIGSDDINTKNDSDLNPIAILATFIFKDSGSDNIIFNGCDINAEFSHFKHLGKNIINSPEAQLTATRLINNFLEAIKDDVDNINEVPEIQISYTTSTDSTLQTKAVFIPGTNVVDNKSGATNADLLLEENLALEIDVALSRQLIIDKVNTLFKLPQQNNFTSNDLEFIFDTEKNIPFTTNVDGTKNARFKARVRQNYFNKQVFLNSLTTPEPTFYISIDETGSYNGKENVTGVGKSDVLNFNINVNSLTTINNTQNIVFTSESITNTTDRNWATNTSVLDFKQMLKANSIKYTWFDYVAAHNEEVEGATDAGGEYKKNEFEDYRKLNLTTITNTNPSLYRVLLESFDNVLLSDTIKTTNFTYDDGTPIIIKKDMTLKQAIETRYKTPHNNKLISESLMIDFKNSIFDTDNSNVFLKISLINFVDSGVLDDEALKIINKNIESKTAFENGTFLTKSYFEGNAFKETKNDDENSKPKPLDPIKIDFVIHFSQIFKITSSSFAFDSNKWRELSVNNSEQKIINERVFYNEIKANYRDLITSSGNSLTVLESLNDEITFLNGANDIKQAITDGRNGMQIKLTLNFRNWRNENGSIEPIKAITYNSKINGTTPVNGEYPFLDKDGNNIFWGGISFKAIEYGFKDLIGTSHGVNLTSWLKADYIDGSDATYDKMINLLTGSTPFDVGEIWNIKFKNSYYFDKTFGDFLKEAISFGNGDGADLTRKIVWSASDTFNVKPTDSGFILEHPTVENNIYDNGKIQPLGNLETNIVFKQWKKLSSTYYFLKTESEIIKQIANSQTKVITKDWRVNETAFQEKFESLNFAQKALLMSDVIDRNKILSIIEIPADASEAEKKLKVDEKIVEIANSIDKITFRNLPEGGARLNFEVSGVNKLDSDFISFTLGNEENVNFFATKHYQNFAFKFDSGGFVAQINNLRKNSPLLTMWKLLLGESSKFEDKKIAIKKILDYWETGSNQFEVFKDLLSLNGLKIDELNSITGFTWKNTSPSNFTLRQEGNRVHIQVNSIRFETKNASYSLERNINDLISRVRTQAVETKQDDVLTSNYWIWLVLGGVSIAMILLLMILMLTLKKRHNNAIEIIKEKDEDRWMK